MTQAFRRQNAHVDAHTLEYVNCEAFIAVGIRRTK